MVKTLCMLKSGSFSSPDNVEKTGVVRISDIKEYQMNFTTDWPLKFEENELNFGRSMALTASLLGASGLIGAKYASAVTFATPGKYELLSFFTHPIFSAFDFFSF